jgi:hypothetical protein
VCGAAGRLERSKSGAGPALGCALALHLESLRGDVCRLHLLCGTAGHRLLNLWKRKPQGGAAPPPNQPRRRGGGGEGRSRTRRGQAPSAGQTNWPNYIYIYSVQPVQADAAKPRRLVKTKAGRTGQAGQATAKTGQRDKTTEPRRKPRQGRAPV